MKDIPKLIGHASSIAYLDIYIVVRVTIYPVVDTCKNHLPMQNELKIFWSVSSVLMAPPVISPS